MTRHVYIVWTHPLFHETVRLLLNHPDIDVVGSCSRDFHNQETLEKLQPDTVIVEETDVQNVTHTGVLQILEDSNWSPRIIRLSMHDNELWIYRRERWTVDSREVLLDLVQGTP